MIVPVVESGDYHAFKRCALERLNVPVVGRVYRVLSDDFREAWTLSRIVQSSAVMNCWFNRFRRHAEGEWTIQFGTFMAFSEHCGDWPTSIAAGKIVEDGQDLPPGSIRDWAVRQGIGYVLKFDFQRISAGFDVRIRMPRRVDNRNEDKKYSAKDKSAKGKRLPNMQASQARVGGQKDRWRFAGGRKR
jgi:hypothetical protein